MQVVLSHLDPRHVKDKQILPLLLVLYNTLNDDDEEIREVGAKIVSCLAKESMVELAAARWLAEDLLLPTHGSTVNFTWAVVRKMTGAGTELDCSFYLIPLNKQIDFAATRDNTLFTEEQPNLYIDECREVEFWTNIFNQLPRQEILGKLVSPWDCGPANSLLDWATEGIMDIVKITEMAKLKLDSDPTIFTGFQRVIACMTALSHYENRMLHLAPDMDREDGFKEWRAKFDCAFDDLSWLAEYSTKQRRGFHPSLFIELLKTAGPKTWLRGGYDAWFRHQNSVVPTIVLVKRPSQEQLNKQGNRAILNKTR